MIMSKRSNVGVFFGVMTALVAGGCVGNDIASRPEDTGGNASTGGSSIGNPGSTGGTNAGATGTNSGGQSAAKGGASATMSAGGTSGTGASANTGGITSNAATTSVGGFSATGGALGAGATNATGGLTSSASSNVTGGALGSGGAISTGGVVNAAGATNTAPATGGTTSTGGANATGGAPSTGGSTTTGGATATGGAPSGGFANTGGTSGLTQTTQTCTSPLQAPQNISATNGTDDTQIVLRWDAVPCAQSYEIYRATSETGTYTLIGTTGLAVFDDTNNQDTIPYYYELRSYSAAQGYSDYSAVVQGSRKQGYVLQTSWGSSGTGDGQLSSAYGIAVDGSSNVYVLDTYNHRVQKFDSSGTFITKWGGLTLSAANGKFYYPYAIGVYGSNVFVGDDLGAVQRFALDGTYIDRFDLTGPQVEDLDFDANGGIYLADDYWASDPENLTIDEYNASYAYQRSFGSSGEQNGQFAGEIHLAVDPARSLVYVSDNGHSEIQLFTTGGTYVTSWGASGTGDMQFNGPAGIAVDSGGSVYVADEGNNRISKFGVTNGTATLAATWSAPQCHALDVDASGRVFVLATNTATVMVYQRR